MVVTQITQCRLCGARFDEHFADYGDGLVPCRQVAGHPLEDGMPWCPQCLGQVDTTARRLLGEGA